MAKFKVVLTDNIFTDLENERKMLAEADAELIIVPAGEDIIPYVKDADAVIDTYVKITEEIVEHMEKCQLVIRNGIGLDTIDVEACTKKGIMVSNIPHYCSDEASTHTMALMLATVRKLKLLNKSVNNGKWDVKVGIPIYSLLEKTLGLVGFGKIPRLVAEKARAFGLNIVAYDPFVSKEDMGACFVRKVELEDLVKESDIISLHTPLTKETYEMFDINMFEKMKTTAYIINTSRGPVIKEEDLIYALENHMIAGAGLDLLTKDALDSENPLLKMDNVIITPHAAWYSEESTIRRKTQMIESVISVLQGGKPAVLCNNPIKG